MLPAGFVERSDATGEFEIWAVNVPAMNLFFACRTQWRQAFGGVTGIDYTALEAVMNMQNLKRKHRPALLSDVSFIESGALNAHYSKDNK